ncbi:MAG: hypothetical protein P8017_15960 [Deltaproteobacteria bacterium]
MLTKQDDLIHAPTGDALWRESHFWNFFDHQSKFGGYFSIGKRPAKGNSGYILFLLGEKNICLYGVEYDKFEKHTNEWKVDGLSYECVAPMETWKVAFDGELVDFGQSPLRISREEMKPVAKSERKKEKVEFNLVFEALDTPFQYSLDSPKAKDFFDRNYYELIGTYKGALKIGAEEYNLDAFGVKNHVWGIRNWFAPDKWRWASIWLNSGEMFIGIYKITVPGAVVTDGYVFRGGKIYRLSEVEEEITLKEVADSPKSVPLACKFKLKDEGGFELDIEGKVLKVVPTVFEKSIEGNRKLLSWNDRCTVEYRSSQGDIGYGELEVSDRLVLQR